MGKIILVVGPIASGKTTYARALAAAENGVVLSLDEGMLALFGPDAGESHDALCARLQAYLEKKAAEIAAAGTCVILDWGPWRRADRLALRERLTRAGCEVSVHAIVLPDDVWQGRVMQRNRAWQRGEARDAYLVDEGLMAKFLSRYEPPQPDEIDVTVPR